MINICFIANFEKTSFFEAVAEKILEKNKHQIFWLAVNKKQSEKLLQTIVKSMPDASVETLIKEALKKL